MENNALLQVKDLSVVFENEHGIVKAVDGISFAIGRGETLGLVGESGSGKTVTALSIMRLVDAPGRVTGGEVIFDGVNLYNLTPERMRKLRGREIAMVFQEPLSALNPVLTVGEQLTEQLSAHTEIGGEKAKRRAMELFRQVRLREPERVYYSYPHNLSGGMRQRAMIAMALSLNPKLLICDEPTTALDVTVQAGIIDLIAEVKAQYGMSVLFITHDFGIVAQLADNVAVMQKGRIAEHGSADDIFYRPKAGYTRELLAAVPRVSYRRLSNLDSNGPK